MIHVLLLAARTGSTTIADQLGRSRDIAVTTGTPCDWGDLTTMLALVAPDVVVLEHETLAGEGLALAEDILRSGGVRPPAVVLAARSEHPLDVVAAARSGVRGYFIEDVDRSPWPEVVRAVAAGGGWLSPPAARGLLDEFASAGGRTWRAPVTLTERELSVLRLIARGCSNIEVAGELGLSKSTVKTHVSRMLARLDLRSRTQLALLARDLGIE